MRAPEPLLPHNLSRRLDELGVKMEVFMRMAMEELADTIARRAKQNANTGQHSSGGHIPGTGPGPNRMSSTLYNSITRTPVDISLKGFTCKIGVSDDAYYARYLETVGLKNGMHYPFILPAMEYGREIAPAIYAANVALWEAAMEV